MMIFKELSPGWNRFALTILFSFSLSLAFPPLQLGFFAYWALVPLFFLLHDLEVRQGILWGYLAGVFWTASTLYWIGWVTIPGLLGVLLVLPMYLAAYAGLHVLFRERFGKRFVFFIPFVWVSIEYLKSIGSLGFPWTSLAYTQTYYTSLIQYATVTGAYGVSFWVVLINVLIFQIARNHWDLRSNWRRILWLIILFLLPYLYSLWVIPRSTEKQESVRVSVVQGNIDPYLKWDEGFLEENFAIFDSLTFATRPFDPDLIVWPETATACYLRLRHDYLQRVRSLSDSLHAGLMTGSPDFRYLENGGYETYNGLLFLQPGSPEIQHYWKIHLVPFGERVPFEDAFPFLHDFLERLNMGTGDFAPGKEIRLFRFFWNGISLPFAGVICFESVFPDLVRRFIQKGARLLVIVTNDAWFGNTSGPYQHARIAVFRAIENRVSIARCANTGVSEFIDPFGRVLSQTDLNQRTVLNAELPLRQETTFYTRYGDLFSYLVLGITGTGLIVSLIRGGNNG